MVTEEKLISFEKKLLLLTILFLPLFRIPQKYSLPLLGGNVSKWFYYLSIIVLIYEFIRYRFRIPKKFIIYVSILLGWQILCSLIGIISYPFTEYFTIGQFSSFQKLNSMNFIPENLFIFFCLYASSNKIYNYGKLSVYCFSIYDMAYLSKRIYTSI